MHPELLLRTTGSQRKPSTKLYELQYVNSKHRFTVFHYLVNHPLQCRILQLPGCFQQTLFWLIYTQTPLLLLIFHFPCVAPTSVAGMIRNLTHISAVLLSGSQSYHAIRLCYAYRLSSERCTQTVVYASFFAHAVVKLSTGSWPIIFLWLLGVVLWSPYTCVENPIETKLHTPLKWSETFRCGASECLT